MDRTTTVLCGERLPSSRPFSRWASFESNYVNPFRCWFHTSVFHPIILLRETFGPLRLLGATLMCIAQTIISYPLNLFYLASTLVCIAQIILISITLAAGYQLACDVVEWCKTKGQDKTDTSDISDIVTSREETSWKPYHSPYVTVRLAKVKWC